MAPHGSHPNSGELEWDENKNNLNKKNHGYSLKKAQRYLLTRSPSLTMMKNIRLTSSA